MCKENEAVFRVDEGFGGARLTVFVHQDVKDCGGGGFVQILDTDRDASISVDFDLWDRITKAVDKRREA